MLIFEQNARQFQTIGLGTLVPSEALVSEELNGDFTLTFQHPYDTGGKWKRIEMGRIVLAETPKGKQPFRIYYHKPTMDGIEVQARHIFYDLMDNICESVEFSGSAQGAMDAIPNSLSIPMPFTFYTDISCDTGSIGCTMDNPVSLLLKEEWNNNEGETKSFFYFYGGELKRDFFNVSMLESLGSDRGVFIAYRKNLVGLEVTEDISDVATRIYPVGKDGLALDGQYIDSLYIGNYAYPKIKVIEDTNAETQSDLQKIAEDYFANGGDIPKVNIKVDFTDLSQTEEYKQYSNLEQVFLGDTVTVFNQKMGFSKKAKVISYKFDPILKKYKSMELGDFSPIVTSPITRGANAGQIANTAYGKSNNAEILLQQHLKDYNNPHRVTAEQVGGGGTGGENAVLHGTKVPSNSLGSDGDYYIKDEVQGVVDENTLLLLHGEDLTDSSMYGVPLINNSVTESEAKSKFGNKSLYFNGDSSIRPANNKILNTSEFTVEWWEYRTTNERYNTVFHVPYTENNFYGFLLGHSDEAGIKIYYSLPSQQVWTVAGVVCGSAKLNQWVHRAFCRKNNQLFAFENGTLKATIPFNYDFTFNLPPYIGVQNLSTFFNGYIDEFRISNIARWTSNFTPPTEPYTVYQNAQPGEIYVKESGTWEKILTGMK